MGREGSCCARLREVGAWEVRSKENWPDPTRSVRDPFRPLDASLTVSTPPYRRDWDFDSPVFCLGYPFEEYPIGPRGNTEQVRRR